MKPDSKNAVPSQGMPHTGQILSSVHGEQHLTANHLLSNQASEREILWHLGLANRELPTNASTVHWGALDGEYSGAGVQIGIIDDGFDHAHPDLDRRFAEDETLVMAAIAAEPSSGGVGHGTAVAGVISAEHNGKGAAGVAPGASLIAFPTDFGEGFSAADLADRLAAQSRFDISNNSWSFVGAFSDDFTDPEIASISGALAHGAGSGRDGLGTAYVFAAGNARQNGDDANLHNVQNSPLVITVGAIDESGLPATFSTPGAPLLVSAPGVNISTTDDRGDAGFSDTDYASLNGTSFAAPIVTGTVALMLEANPELGYRDIQRILAATANQPQNDNGSWQENGAAWWNGGGLTTSRDYGFGVVDVHAAVRLAETWDGQRTFASRQEVALAETVGAFIPDGNGSLEHIFRIGESIEIEHVELAVEIDHGSRGDLTVTLVSPAGTESTLIKKPGVAPDGTWTMGGALNDIRFSLTSTEFLGESTEGEWRIVIEDDHERVTGRFESFAFAAVGEAEEPDDVYIFTEEFAQLAGRSRDILSDTGGIDAINSAAVMTDSLIDLRDGSVSQIAGRPLVIEPRTEIEHAVGGDGDDTLRGSDTANLLQGMRGDDVLESHGGGDTLVGGPGADRFVFSSDNGPTVVADFSLEDGDRLVFRGEQADPVVRSMEIDGTLGVEIAVAGGQVFLAGMTLADAGRLLSEGSVEFAESTRTDCGPVAFRYFGKETHAHYYIADPDEVDVFMLKPDMFQYEGPSFSSASPGCEDSIPVYRFSNTKTDIHFYTISLDERDNIIDAIPQFEDDGIVFYAFAEDQESAIPVYRFFNPNTGAHFFTPDEAERDHVMNSLTDFEYEGIGFYANSLVG